MDPDLVPALVPVLPDPLFVPPVPNRPLVPPGLDPPAVPPGSELVALVEPNCWSRLRLVFDDKVRVAWMLTPDSKTVR